MEPSARYVAFFCQITVLFWHMFETDLTDTLLITNTQHNLLTNWLNVKIHAVLILTRTNDYPAVENYSLLSLNSFNMTQLVR